MSFNIPFNDLMERATRNYEQSQIRLQWTDISSCCFSSLFFFFFAHSDFASICWRAFADTLQWTWIKVEFIFNSFIILWILNFQTSFWTLVYVLNTLRSTYVLPCTYYILILKFDWRLVENAFNSSIIS